MKPWLKALIITVAIPLLAIALTLTWQSLRWTFASPLALAFHEQEITGSASTSFSHAEVRKFVALDIESAAVRARDSGFSCSAALITRAQTVCYRDIVQGLCTQLWRIQLVFGEDATVSRASASIRQTCWRLW
jgi:hypothetical protein